MLHQPSYNSHTPITKSFDKWLVSGRVCYHLVCVIDNPNCIPRGHKNQKKKQKYKDIIRMLRSPKLVCDQIKGSPPRPGQYGQPHIYIKIK